MPTVLRLHGLRFVIYPNDHSPAHVHVLGPGWSVIVNLVDLTLREVQGASRRDAAQARELAAAHAELLRAAWRSIHG